MKLARSRPALPLALFAVLLQAVLFGWHHHDLAFAAPDVPAGVSAPASGGPQSPDVDADGCDICIVLHHQAAAAAAFILVPRPAAAIAPAPMQERRLVVARAARAFDSRAPPLL